MTQVKKNQVMLRLKKSSVELIEREHLYRINVLIKGIKITKVINLMKIFKELVEQLEDVLECKIN